MNLKKSLLHFALLILIGTSCQQNNQPTPSPTNNNNNNGGNTTTQSWVPATPFASPNGIVYCMTVYNNELYIGGTFNQVGGVVANGGIAKWNGTSWAAVPGPGTPVRHMVVFNGNLFVSSNHVLNSNNAYPLKKWNGLSWTNTGIYGVSATCINNGQLIVTGGGGIKDSLGNILGSVATYATNNSWSFLPAGAGGHSICVYNNEIYTGGGPIKKWSGSAWIDVTGVTSNNNNTIQCLDVLNNKLIAAGSIGSIGGITAHDVMQYDGTQWSNVGFSNGISTPPQSPGFVNSTLLDGNDLYFGTYQGYWTGAAWQRVVKWNGSQWSGLAGNSNLQPSGFPYFIYSIIKYNGTLFIGGDFSGGTTTTYFINLCKLQ
ncbi:MAG: hypothetical protein ACK452_06330 [Bacteroidota bacterium]|jgi:hypothetical protein